MSSETLIKIAYNVKILRARKQLSLARLSELSGVSLSTLSFIENGKTKHIRTSTLYKIAQVLDVEVSDLKNG